MTFIPGAAAFVNALVLSGKPAHEFYFAGFLPNRTGARKNQLERLKKLNCTLVFYESCHRILASLDDIGVVFGDREIVVARELTKKFEEILRASPKNIQEKLSQNKPRGEFVIVI
jgi:16S rRNA (cytidine1402-2'-O)-methyltransferase